ncbi:uncharacterized protein LOC135927679 isoform X2 [Gordionus sp. m RMFG-2023]|uniref:uncharacterized protein LOC135927679 isoform X2 n=1 Tax=Gordionus sp. m RMFG-2023 TaxID=3053472 RepID=UPI0031FE1FA6
MNAHKRKIDILYNNRARKHVENNIKTQITHATICQKLNEKNISIKHSIEHVNNLKANRKMYYTNMQLRLQYNKDELYKHISHSSYDNERICNLITKIMTKSDIIKQLKQSKDNTLLFTNLKMIINDVESKQESNSQFQYIEKNNENKSKEYVCSTIMMTGRIGTPFVLPELAYLENFPQTLHLGRKHNTLFIPMSVRQIYRFNKIQGAYHIPADAIYRMNAILYTRNQSVVRVISDMFVQFKYEWGEENNSSPRPQMCFLEYDIKLYIRCILPKNYGAQLSYTQLGSGVRVVEKFDNKSITYMYHNYYIDYISWPGAMVKGTLHDFRIYFMNC